jgi:hypothetical protein
MPTVYHVDEQAKQMDTLFLRFASCTNKKLNDQAEEVLIDRCFCKSLRLRHPLGF